MNKLKAKRLGHIMVPRGVMADHGELQCVNCGATNFVSSELQPDKFKCSKSQPLPRYNKKEEEGA